MERSTVVRVGIPFEVRGELKVKDLMKTEWREVLESLEKVPIDARNEAWMKTMELIKGIIEGPCSVTVPAVPQELRWAPSCSLCRKAIMLDQDYVFRSISCTFSHYDCFYMPDSER